MKILIVSSEVTPFAKTGGLADVSAALARQLARDGQQVRLMMPLYRRVRERHTGELRPVPGLQGLRLELGTRSFTCSVSSLPLPNSDVTLELIDCPALYDRPELYTSDADEHLRFALLSRVPLDACQHTQWAPDVVHCNDWHTGLLPLYLHTRYAWDRLFERTKTVLTIHNLGYQGRFAADVVEDLGLGDSRHLFYQEALAGGSLSFLETGLLYADALTTVSRTYAREIQTPEYGMGLDELLRARADRLVGIVNGIDYAEWDPASDPAIAANYAPGDMDGKEVCKRWLLDEFGLDPAERVPLFGIVSRLTGQKGFDLLPDILPVLLRRLELRLVVLGSGEVKLERYFQWLRNTFPGSVAFFSGYNADLAHAVEAGADAFLMPSRYEPCGLNQMYSLRYGTVPVVRRTGGLADTVEDYDAVTGEGTGFVFDAYDSDALMDAMLRCAHAYRDAYTWQRIVANGMARDYSWRRQAREYVELYRGLIES